MKTRKYNYAKREAIYSIQFWYDEKERVLSVTETSNPSEKMHDFFSMYLFGINIAKSKLLDRRSKKSFRSFCKSFLEHCTD